MGLFKMVHSSVIDSIITFYYTYIYTYSLVLYAVYTILPVKYKIFNNNTQIVVNLLNRFIMSTVMHEIFTTMLHHTLLNCMILLFTLLLVTTIGSVFLQSYNVNYNSITVKAVKIEKVYL